MLPLPQFKNCRLALERLTLCPHRSCMVYILDEQGSKKLALDHEVTSLASVMEHITFSLALCKSKKIARKICARNARIHALGFGASRLSTFSCTAPKPSAGIRAFLAQSFLAIFFDLHNARPKVMCSITEANDATT